MTAARNWWDLSRGGNVVMGIMTIVLGILGLWIDGPSWLWYNYKRLNQTETIFNSRRFLWYPF